MQDIEGLNLPLLTIRLFPISRYFDVGIMPKNNYNWGVPDTKSPFPVSSPRAWAEISYANLRHNYCVMNQHQQGAVMAVLKAGAYGHGIEKIAEALENLEITSKVQRPTFFGVASVIEARRLAEAGIKTRIYLLGPSCPFEREEIVARSWTPCISSMDEARSFNSLAKDTKLNVHLTVDTGMGRGGFLPDELVDLLGELDKLEHLHIEGIGSHLPSADEDEAFTRQQFDRFDKLVETLGVDRFKFIHLANSAGILGYQSRCTNLYRPGLMLYGISPINQFQNELKPVLSLRSKVSLVRTLPAGQGISYGRDTVLEKETKVATIGIGYGDGYPRAVSSHEATVLIRDQRCHLLGRVTMDQIMVDVSALPHCESGDEVELFGENILVSEIANLAGTIPWAVLTGITPRVTRIYIEG